MRKYKIGEVARLLQTTTQALRFYEQEGVIVPQKSENGTRYFTESDIIRLMAFKRFQLIDFSVQDVAQHFTGGNLESLVRKMGEKSALLVRKSQELLRRARAIDNFELILCHAQQHMGEMTHMSRPDIYIHPCTLGNLEHISGRHRETFDQYMDAMPDAHICFLYDQIGAQPLRFHFAIKESSARDWGLSLEDAICLPGCDCVQLFVRTDARLWQRDFLDAQIARVEEAGYTVDRASPMIGQQLASEAEGKLGYLIAAIYVPVLPEN